MGINVNGTNLDDCKTVKVNGYYAKSVVVNYVEVWKEQCFAGIWTGSTICGYPGTMGNCIGSHNNGMDTSGTLARYSEGFLRSSDVYYGSWVESNPQGIGNGTSRSGQSYIAFHGNALGSGWDYMLGYSGDMSFDLVGKFSGRSTYNGTMTGGWAHTIGFTSSGGNMRYQIEGGQCGNMSTYGDWITIN
jgi:hypothetical protein